MRVSSENPGAFVLDAEFLDRTEIEEAAELARALQVQQRPVHEAGAYAGLRWLQVDLDPQWPIAAKLLNLLGVGDPELLVFYYLDPGAKLHPHRDLTGANLNNRLRFHVPIITNPDVDFRVAGERVVMRPGELWCLDTSYVHSVENRGEDPRVHMIVECAISPTTRARIPRTPATRLHDLQYASILAVSLLKALTINLVKNPAYLRAQLGMVARFIGWRVFRTSRAR